MKNKKVKQKKTARRRRMHCPYCGSPVIYRTADGIYKENELVQFEDMLQEFYIVLRQYARKKVKACRKTT